MSGSAIELIKEGFAKRRERLAQKAKAREEQGPSKVAGKARCEYGRDYEHVKENFLDTCCEKSDGNFTNYYILVMKGLNSGHDILDDIKGDAASNMDKFSAAREELSEVFAKLRTDRICLDLATLSNIYSAQTNSPYISGISAEPSYAFTKWVGENVTTIVGESNPAIIGRPLPILYAINAGLADRCESASGTFA